MVSDMGNLQSHASPDTILMERLLSSVAGSSSPKRHSGSTPTWRRDNECNNNGRGGNKGSQKREQRGEIRAPVPNVWTVLGRRSTSWPLTCVMSYTRGTRKEKRKATQEAIEKDHKNRKVGTYASGRSEVSRAVEARWRLAHHRKT